MYFLLFSPPLSSLPAPPSPSVHNSATMRAAMTLACALPALGAKLIWQQSEPESI